jgi:peptide/nickel transport system permease protein
MGKWLLRRLFQFIPSFIGVILIFSLIISNLPGDPIMDKLVADGLKGESLKNTYIQIAEKENLPFFYFGIGRLAIHDSIYSIKWPQDKEAKIEQAKFWNGSYSKEKINWKYLVPKIIYYGKDNRFHQWIFSSQNSSEPFVSSKDGRFVPEKIFEALKWTLAIQIPLLILIILLGVPLGIYLVNTKSKWIENSIIAFQAMPLFFISTLSVILFASSTFGMKIFPSVGIWSQDIFSSLPKLILPILVSFLGTSSLWILQVKSAYKENVDSFFFLSAKSRGLYPKDLMIQYGLKNSLLTLLPIVSGFLPFLIAGSVSVEIIFVIPGIGKLLLESILTRDWSVVTGIMFLTSFFTMSGILLGDFIKKWIDPRTVWN